MVNKPSDDDRVANRASAVAALPSVVEHQESNCLAILAVVLPAAISQLALKLAQR